MSDHGHAKHSHHFKSVFHEFSTCKQGLWLFLLQEVLFFSPLFVGYLIFRGLYPEMWAFASSLLDPKLGGINTVVLITSSLSMAMAVNAAQHGKNDKCFKLLAITFLCACGFLVIKYLEYSHKIHVGLVPSKFMAQFADGTLPLAASDKEFLVQALDKFPNLGLFFSIYFAMTGLHGIHVVGGMVVIVWLMVRCRRNEFDPEYYTPVEMVGLYWHFVDLVWIYLFPMLYLVG